MVRNNRQVIRLFFLLVILMGFAGWWFALTYWLPQLETDFTQLSTFTQEEFDWIEVTSIIGEEAIKLFFGLFGRE